MRGRLMGVAVLLSCLSFAPSARADQPVVMDDPDTEAAKRHFRSGSDLYDKHDYEAASKEFEAALMIKPLPAFYYNIARCYDRLERYDEAIRAYQTYLDSGARDQNEEVSARILALKQRLAAQKAGTQLAKARSPEEDGVLPLAPGNPATGPQQPPVVEGNHRTRNILIAVGAAVVVVAAIAIIGVAAQPQDAPHMPGSMTIRF